MPFSKRRAAQAGTITAAMLGLTTSMLGGVAHADIPGAGGVYTGCYTRSNGALRVIDFEAGQRCRSTELTVTWNRTGQPGPAGPQGPQGPQGLQGETGPAGTVDIIEVPGPFAFAPAGGEATSTAVCPADHPKAISGGFRLGFNAFPIDSRQGTTNTPDDSWSVQFQNTGSVGRNAFAIAYCSS
jgi:hypothetical protein